MSNQTDSDVKRTILSLNILLLAITLDDPPTPEYVTGKMLNNERFFLISNQVRFKVAAISATGSSSLLTVELGPVYISSSENEFAHYVGDAQLQLTLENDKIKGVLYFKTLNSYIRDYIRLNLSE